jgi:hypothetical protein
VEVKDPIADLKAVRALIVNLTAPKKPNGASVKHLDVALATLERMPESIRPRIAAAIGVTRRWDYLRNESIEVLCPAYPNATRVLQARLALGEPPTKVLAGLTSKEAHHALTQGYDNPIHYLLREHQLGRGRGIRTVDVARWLVACYSDEERRDALLKERIERGPHGEEIHGTLLHRVDELMDDDLPNGTATGVNVAFDRAASRAWDNWQKENATKSQPLAATPRWWRPVRCARLLMSAGDLVREGKEMGHCVGSYSHYVRTGMSVIVSIAVRARNKDGSYTLHRSTADIDREMTATDGDYGTHVTNVLQHRGRLNADPPDLCVKALEVCLTRWSRKEDE